MGHWIGVPPDRWYVMLGCKGFADAEGRSMKKNETPEEKLNAAVVTFVIGLPLVLFLIYLVPG